MNDDFSEVINKFSDILKDKNIDLNNLAGGSSPSADNSMSNPESNSDFNLDINTILKIKDIISKMNKNQDCPRNKLLHSLKPYLENDKQGYDFVLIITLFLLIF